MMKTSPTKKLYVVITVDVESSDSPKAVNRNGLVSSMVYGKFGGTYWGFPKIMEICDRHQCKATFFVSALQYGKGGEVVFSEISREIKHKGHDIQLHTHPIWGYGQRYMYNYSLEEQIRIIGDGTDLLEKWTGERPVGYRAGAYSIDAATLRALSANRISVDSSMFYNQPTCRFCVTKNRVVEVDQIIELPVTICQCQSELAFGSLRYKRQPYYSKTDIDWLTLSELLWFVEQAKVNNLRVMTLFLHSYSFVKFDSSFSRFRPDHEDTEKFDRFLLAIAKDPEIEIITLKQFYTLYCRNPDIFTNASDHVPYLSQRIGLIEAIPMGFNLIKTKILK